MDRDKELMQCVHSWPLHDWWVFVIVCGEGGSMSAHVCTGWAG